MKPVNSPSAPAPAGGYSQAAEVDGIIAGIFDEQWLLEIEAVAAD